MRQVKFRYWNGSKVLNQEAIINHLNKYIARNDKHLMQFTGLFDKQGVEVYEGDIIRVNKLTYDKNNEFEPFVSKIEFYMGSFHLDTKKMLLLSYGKDIEVIGNIYENKELLV